MPTTFSNYKSIEEILLDLGKINQQQLEAIRISSVNTGLSTKDIIREGNYVNAEGYALAYSKAYNVEYVTLKGKKIDPSLFDVLPLDYIRKYEAVPFNKTSEVLQVAMTDPVNLEVIEFIERKAGLKVIAYVTTKADISAVLEEAKTKTLSEDVTKALQEISTTTEALKIDGSGTLTKDDAILKDAPVARIVGMIIETAVKLGASDIHLEPAEEIVRLRYRIDGVLEERRTFPKEMSDTIAARIKVLSGLKIDEKRIPQDGRFKVQVGESFTDLRVSTLPTVYGEKIVIRLLKEESTIYTFQELGMRGLTIRRFEEALLKPVGMLLVTGPTGSGKTVTLASALQKLNTSKVNIVTIEDPVEIRVNGVNQVQVNVKAGLTFASALRSFLRQDPNIIMVGEIRDEETAALGIQAALTGHLVLSTLHTNSSAGAIPRLLDMNVENYLLSSTLNGILAQRLIRKLCSNCRQEYDAPEDIKTMIKETLKDIQTSQVIESKDKGVYEAVQQVESGNFKLYRPVGCDKCNNIGYKGRVGIFEFLQISTEVSKATLEKRSSQEIELIAKKEGMLTLVQDGFLKCIDGTTNISEVLRVAYE
jgi:type IV pilus assembly protein PilB